MAKKGGECLFGKNIVTVYKDSVPVLNGVLDPCGMYRLNIEFGKKFVNQVSNGKEETLWHARLGHLNSIDIQRLGLQSGSTKEAFMSTCKVCIKAKSFKMPFEKNRKTQRETIPLKLVHADVKGPMETVGFDGGRYYVTFIDDCTDMTIVYVLRSRDEVFQCYQDFEAMTSNHFNGKRICRLRIDNGGEFISNEMNKYCRERGVWINTTNPYTPQQNGVAERRNRTIMEKAKSFLLQANLPNVFWPYAVYTAVFLMNRVYSKSIGDIPFRKWFGKDYNYKYLRVWGCRAFVHVPKEKRKALDDKAEEGIFIGYTDNGYQ
jgi:transposase InsO family protein